MQPNQQNNQTTPNTSDALWISREEYDRLRATSVAPPAYQNDNYNAPVVSSPAQYNQPPVVQKRKFDALQTIAGVILAGSLYLSLTSKFFHVLIIPVLLALLVYSVMSLIDYLKNRKNLNNQILGGYTYAQPGLQSKKQTKYGILIIVICCLLITPLILIGGFILLMIIMLSLGGGQGS